jgi:O-antigen/teichoic acid export membrane protein
MVGLTTGPDQSPRPGSDSVRSSTRTANRWPRLIAAVPARLHGSVRTGTLALADQGIVSVTSILTSIVVARACGQEAFGVFVLGMSIVLLTLELQSALISTPYLVNSPPLSGDRARRYAGSALLHQITLAAIVGAALAFATLVAAPAHLHLRAVGWVLALGVPFIILRDFLRRHCFARRKFGSAFVMDLGVGVAQLAALGTLAVAAWLTASRSLAVVATAAGLGAALWIGANRADFSPDVREAVADARRHWSVGRWVFASGILWAVAAQLYPWLLAALRGAADAGAWGASMGICAALNVPFLAGQNVLGPRIARARPAHDARAFCVLVLRLSAAFAALLLVAALPLLLFGGRFLGLLYGRTYTSYGSAVAVLAVGMAFLAAGFGVSRGLFCLDRADLDFLVNLAPFAVLLLLGPVLVRSHGVLGAAFTALVAYALAAGLRVVALLFASSRAAGAPPS